MYLAKNLLKYKSSLQNCRNEYFYYSTKHAKLLGLLCRFRELNVLYSTKQKKLFKYSTGSSLQNRRNKYLYYFTKHEKKLFKYPGSSVQIWRNKYLYYSNKQKKNSFKNISWVFIVELKKWIFSLFYQAGLLCRLEKKIYHTTKHKKLLVK